MHWPIEGQEFEMDYRLVGLANGIFRFLFFLAHRKRHSTQNKAKGFQHGNGGYITRGKESHTDLHHS
jgi:hypothetical protein